MADAKTSILIQADGSQAKAEFQGVSNAAKNLEKHIANAGKGAKASGNTIATSAEDASRRMAASHARFLKQLETQANTIGKSKAEVLEYKAAQRGLSEAAAPFIAKLKEAENATDGMGMSAKQTANAMRLIPMQMTDIVTQLAGGQNPLLILTQQGGQLKDVFGGVGPALRGVGSYLMAIINPFSVAAAAIGTFVVAAQMGSMESEKLGEAITLTGGYAGKSTAQLSAMAKEIGNTVGTTSQAADALTQLVGTGKIAGDQLKTIGTAAVAMQEATGKAIDDTVKEFVKLGEEPSKAILKLNESQHFLTSAIYEQIAALEDQGRKEEAAQLAQQTYARAVTDRANTVIRDTGLMERAWNALAGAAKSAWNAMMDVGRPTGLAGELAEAQDKLAKMLTLRNLGSFDPFDQVGKQRAHIADLQERIRLENKLLGNQREQARIHAASIEAQDAIKRQREQTASNEEKRNKALEEYRRHIEAIRKADPQSKLLDPAKIATDEKNIREKYKDPKGATVRDDAATRMLMQLKEQEAALNAQLETSGKLGIKTADLAKFEQQIADIKTKAVLTADQKSLLANEDALRAQLQKNAALEKEVKLKQESAKLDALRQSLDAQLAVDRQQYEESLSIQGQGRRAQDELRAQQRIVRDYQRQLQQAGRDRLTGAISEETYQSQIDLLQSSLDQRLELQRDYFAQLRVIESDWRVGASAALADYSDYASNIARSAADAFGNAFKGMEDALTEFVTTGKLSFADFADSIIKDMVRIAVQRNITGPLAGALGSFFGPSSTPAPAGVTPGVDWTFPGRASGGPVSAGKMYEVNERGIPELLSVGNRQFLMMGRNGGLVTPASAAGAGGGQAAPSVQINVINQSSQPVTAKQGPLRFDAIKGMVQDVILVDLRTNGPVARGIKGMA